MSEYNTQNPAGNGSDELPITEEVRQTFAEAMDLMRRPTTNALRVYNTTTETWYVLTLTGSAGNEVLSYTLETIL